MTGDEATAQGCLEPPQLGEAGGTLPGASPADTSIPSLALSREPTSAVLPSPLRGPLPWEFTQRSHQLTEVTQGKSPRPQPAHPPQTPKTRTSFLPPNHGEGRGVWAGPDPWGTSAFIKREERPPNLKMLLLSFLLVVCLPLQLRPRPADSKARLSPNISKAAPQQCTSQEARMWGSRLVPPATLTLRPAGPLNQGPLDGSMSPPKHHGTGHTLLKIS